MAQSSNPTSHSSYKSDMDSKMKEIYKNNGVDMSAVMDFLRKAPGDPVTGVVSPEDLMVYMVKNMDHPLMRQLEGTSDEVKRACTGTFDADFTGFDWNSLASTITKDAQSTEGWWHLALENFGFADAQGNPIDTEDAPRTPGAQPVFYLNCRHNQKARQMERVNGLPNSETVIRFIKRSIVTPYPGIHRGLPRLLLISIKLSQHREALAAFLDTLPAPFKWSIEIPEFASKVDDYLDQRMKDKLGSYMDAAEAHKVEANRAFKEKNFKTAIEEYGKAIDRAKEVAFSDRAEEAAGQAARRLLAVCHANRAAAYLLPGDELDVKKALKDGQQAERHNPDYAKGYYRQAKAHQARGDVQQAKKALDRALSRPALAEDKALSDLLGDLHL